jgi:NADH dehydrogenase
MTEGVQAERTRVAVIGGGFAGLRVAKGLSGSGASITLIDRHNYHVFQPLLYHTIRYDFLVVATGATHAYFGHDEWRTAAPGLKTLDDALEIRRRVLLAFERAERQDERPSAGHS